MSRTHRNVKHSGYLRHPKGRKQALIRGDRSVPPDDWDDISISEEALRQKCREDDQVEDSY